MVPTAIERNDEFHATLINVGELTDPAENVLERVRLDRGGNSGGVQCRVDGKEVRSITEDMRGSHGSSINGHGFAVDPGRDNPVS